MSLELLNLESGNSPWPHLVSCSVLFLPFTIQNTLLFHVPNSENIDSDYKNGIINTGTGQLIATYPTSIFFDSFPIQTSPSPSWLLTNRHTLESEFLFWTNTEKEVATAIPSNPKLLRKFPGRFLPVLGKKVQ